VILKYLSVYRLHSVMVDFILGLRLAGLGVGGESPRMLIVVDEISDGVQQIHYATHDGTVGAFRVEQAIVETVI